MASSQQRTPPPQAHGPTPPWPRGLAAALVLLLALVASGCGDDGEPADTLDTAATSDAADGTDAPPSDTQPSTDTARDTDQDGPADGLDTTDTQVTGNDTTTQDTAASDTQDQDADATDTSTSTCPAGALGQRLGRNHLLIGGSMDDAAYAGAPFDLRYLYLAGAVPSGGPCASCASGCTVEGQSCANSAGCAWWGCWQWDQVPPGQYVINHINDVRAAGGIPMITYYVWYSVAGYVEGQPEVDALQDGSRVADYLADWRFVCQSVAAADDEPVILHVEPDLWGYGHQISSDPTTIPVALSAAAAPECAGLGNHFAGLARCMARIARAEAPNALVGLHASAWGAGHDALSTTYAGFDLPTHAGDTAAFMGALGADALDLVVVEMSDRDAGFNGSWWDATDATVPNFARAIEWVDRMSGALGVPALWWQVPFGNEALEDVCDRYRDNRVRYVFDHPERFAAGNALGVAFGAGAGCMTTPATDDGYFVSRAAAYYAGTRPCLCGSCP